MCKKNDKAPPLKRKEKEKQSDDKSTSLFNWHRQKMLKNWVSKTAYYFFFQVLFCLKLKRIPKKKSSRGG